MASFACTIERITSASPLLPRAAADLSAPRLLFRSLPSHLRRLLSGDPVDVAALFTLTRITITLVRLHIQPPMSRRNVDNDGATVIRGTIVAGQSGLNRTGPDRSGDHPANERHRKHDWLLLSVSLSGASDEEADIIAVQKWSFHYARDSW